MTALSPDETVRNVRTYYENAFRYIPNEEKINWFKETVACGMTIMELFAAIDYALSVCGFGRPERDYWPHVQRETRRIWKEMNRKTAAP